MSSLGLSAYHAGASDFAPRVEYNAKSGRFCIVNRAQGTDGAFASDKVDVTMQKPIWALDLGSIEVGWINFPPGTGPQMIMVPFGEPMPERPDRTYKAGFKLQLWDGHEATARRFMSNAGVVVEAIEELWDEATATVQAASGDIPVVQLLDVLAVTGGRGTNYAPVFSVIKWTARDDRVFGPRTVPPIGGLATRPMIPAARLPAAPAARPLAARPPAAWDAPAPRAGVAPIVAHAPVAAARVPDEEHRW